MGMKLSKLASERIQAAQDLDRQRHPEKYQPVAGRLTFFVAGEPPTVTHHDKDIQRRGRHVTLVDSPALRAAKQHYLLAIRERRCIGGAADSIVAGPLLARVTFCWGDPAMPAGTPPRWMELKPDLDNAAKALLDAIAERGWIENDSKIARLVVQKAHVPVGRAGVIVAVETLLVPPLIEWVTGRLTFEPFFVREKIGGER